MRGKIQLTCLIWEPADEPISRCRRWRRRTKTKGSMKFLCTSVKVLMTSNKKLIAPALLSSLDVWGAVTVVTCFCIKSSTFWYNNLTSGGVEAASWGKATQIILNSEQKDLPASKSLCLKHGSRIWREKQLHHYKNWRIWKIN